MAQAGFEGGTRQCLPGQTRFLPGHDDTRQAHSIDFKHYR
ncbi:hypothetical protein BH10PSE2_BH10PSE2_04910 [soil metagenome]